MLFSRQKSEMVRPEDALPGRPTPMRVADRHLVLGTPMEPPFPDGMATLVVGMGCFWGAERKFWELPGVYTTAVGYAGGYTPNPTYEEVVLAAAPATPRRCSSCSTRPSCRYEELLRVFWESHDPTQGMRQGNDAGTQYRSAIYTTDPAQAAAVDASRAVFQAAAGRRPATARSPPRSPPAGPFFYAEDYHQQYLAKNPNGYCGLGGTGVSCPVGLVSD